MVGVMIQTAFLVIAILAVQKIFGAKLHAYVRYGLWLLIAVRLMIPVNLIDSPFSMLQAAETIRLSDAVRESMDLQRKDSSGQADVSGGQEMSLENILQSVSVGIDAEKVSLMENTEGTAADVAEIGASDAGQTDYALRADGAALKEDAAVRRMDMKRLQSAVTKAYLSGMISKICHAIWFAGSLLVGGVLGVSHFRFRRRLRKTRVAYKKGLPNIVRKTRVPVYFVKGLETPCLVGLIQPAIYIGTDIDTISDHFRYAVVHEEVHYLHRDHIWAFVRAVLVAVYWFHPFVWIAAAFSVKDGEIACDYGTIRRLGKEERFAYGEMLLALSGTRRGKRIYSYGTMLRPGRSELKERILRLTQKNGSRVWAGILAVLLMVIVAGCAFTGAAEIDNDKTILLVNEADKDVTDMASDEKIDAADGDETEISGESSSEEGGPQPGNGEGIIAKPAEISEETHFGVDGPHLDYAGGMGTDEGSRIIFHDYFGLIVYDLNKREIVRSLDLVYIGCDKTQGDDYCETAVSADGHTVWLHPISKEYMYRYEVEENLLYQEQIEETFAKELETEELFDRYVTVLTVEQPSAGWHSNYLYEEYKDEQGLHNAYIYLYAPGNSDITDDADYKLVLRNLNCVWDDMLFMLFQEDINTGKGASAQVGEELIPNTTGPTDNTEDRAGQTEDAAERFPYSSPYDINNAVKIIYEEPCVYNRISDVFGERIHPITGAIRVHDGIDYAADEGTSIVAVADGEVYETGYSAEHGNYVVLLHMNGDMTYYCHCQGVTVKEADQVKRGDKIATVGQTGQATGPHLHFALSRDGKFVNPQDYM